MKQEIPNIDDLLDDEEKENQFNGYKPRHKAGERHIQSANDMVDEPKQKKSKVEDKKKKDDLKLIPSENAVESNAKKMLQYYLTTSPQYKTLQKQIDLIQEEVKNYKTAGRQDLIDKSNILLKELIQSRSEFRNIYKNKNYKAENAENAEKIKNSTELKDLKIKRTELEQEFKNKNPNSLGLRLNDLRKQLAMFADAEAKNSKKIEDIEDLADIEDIDDVLDDDELDNTLASTNLKQDYNNLCADIAEICDVLPSEIAEMKITQVVSLLKQNTDADELEKLKTAIDGVKFEASAEISRLKGNEDITSVMYKIFDFEQTPEERPKEMLAAANVPYVKAIAYSTCSKLNMLHNFPDAISYGLLGLSIAIDKWYHIQKLKDSAVSFNGFAHLYISNNIKKGLYELTSGGMLNKSSIATLMHKRSKQVSAFMVANPDLKDLPEEMVENILEGIGMDKPGTVVTESGYSETIGGEDGGSADIWANAAASSMGDENYLDIRAEYENLLKSLKALFGLFKVKENKETGIREITDKKYFNKYDFKLFKLLFGLEFKTTVDASGSTIRSNYTQEEIRLIMLDYHKMDGDTIKTLSQSAISTAKKELLLKLEKIWVEYPQIKAGLQAIMNNFEANRETANLVSNEHESINVDLDLDVKLEDIPVDSNALDDEIANIFEEQ